jgi:hypothetical protein
MYHILPSMNCLFDSTELLFNMLSEYDLYYKDELNFHIIDTIIYKYRMILIRSGVPISYYFMENKKIYYKNNYKDLKIQQIINNCITKKHSKTEVCAMFISQEKKYKVNDEENNIPYKGTDQHLS